MSSKKIKVLGIAPYEGLRTLMSSLADQRDDLELTTYIGDLDKGVEIVKQINSADYDAIISRGGTAEKIGQLVDLPVIEINLSVYDILRAIKLAENCSSEYVIVGFPSITESARLLCDLLQYDIDQYTIRSTEDAKNALKEVQSRGIRIVICDMVTNTLAVSMGLNPILITSGSESIISAFDQAVKLCRSYATTKAQNRFYDAVLKQQPMETLVYSVNHCLQFSTLSSGDNSELLAILEKEIDRTLDYGTQQIQKTIGSSVYTIHGSPLIIDDKTFVSFYITKNKILPSSNRIGLKTFNKTDIFEAEFQNFYDISSGYYQTVIQQFYNRNVPLLLLGEPGTGKEQMAGAIYTQSKLQNCPFVTVDFEMIHEKCWAFLFNHEKSPFLADGITLYLKNIQSLDESKSNQLFAYMDTLSLYRHNKIIISFTYKNQESKNDPICTYLITKCSALVITLSPLREQRENISNLASLCINMLNMRLAKQVIGFEPDGLRLIEEFSWPYNMIQFYKVLETLVEHADGPYISSSAVLELLTEERRQIPTASPADKNFYRNRTLDEINRDIAKLVLEECKNNQSQAAKVLGISRTTLWRMIK